jgi:Potential Queuosine, Q, salvage protein family
MKKQEDDPTRVIEKDAHNICDKVRQSCFDWMGEEEESLDLAANSSNTGCNNSRKPSRSYYFGAGKKYVCIHSDKLQDVVAHRRILAGVVVSPDFDDGDNDCPTSNNETEETTVAAAAAVAPAVVTWDEEAWHYQPPTTWPNEIRQERIALYILALDAINFCFWPASTAATTAAAASTDNNSNKYEYVNLACTLTAMAQADHEQQETDLSAVSRQYVFLPSNLKNLTVDAMQTLFLQHGRPGQLQQPLLVPPDLDRRCALWNEVGSVLLEKFHGSAMTLIRSAHQSAVQLVQILYNNFAGFRDQVELVSAVNDIEAAKKHQENNNTTTTTTTIFFLKRAQICVGDWHAALQLQKDEEEEEQHGATTTTTCSKSTTATTSNAAWSDMNQLTTFADYRLPQLLRHWQVLEYCDTGLQQAVDGQHELQRGSDEEISIRAATVVCVEKLVTLLNNHHHALQRKQQQQQQQQQQHQKDRRALLVDAQEESPAEATKSWTAVQVDWYLWQVGERMDSQGELQPHHRVRTIYY